jgi:hypothetical protein
MKELIKKSFKNSEFLEKCNGFNKVIKRLKNEQEYFGALFELEVAHSLVKSGLKVMLQPKLKSGKSCDIYVPEKNTFIEIKTLGRSNVEKRIFEIMNCIFENLEGRNVRIKIEFTQELAKFLEFINFFYLPTQKIFMETIEKIIINNLKEKITCLPTKGQIDRFATISVERSKNFSLQMFGPGIAGENFRVLCAYCIREASEQLPKTSRGIVFIRSFFRIKRNLVKTILQKILQKYKHIAGIVFLQGYFANGFLYKKLVIKNFSSKFSFPNFLYRIKLRTK